MFDLSLFEFLAGSDQRRSVLVVDDDLSIKPMMAKVLYSIDSELNLSWATNLEEAKTILHKRKQGLVISDYLLGENETGLELWDFCRKKYPAIPFIMISGLTVQSIERVIGELDQWPMLLHKTRSMRECREVIQSVLSGEGND
jgi:DNA-binding NtrC family response regulator